VQDSTGDNAILPAGTHVFDSDQEDFTDTTNAPAWQDSDDERLLVSLASNNRLRKLRRTEEEDVINGREYARRLRQQFEKLNPAPDWAKASTKLKRRYDESTEDEDSDDDLGENTQPLAKLLRSANGLVSRDTTKSKKRKLRAEVVNIQRQKHITNNGPVSQYLSLIRHYTNYSSRP